MPSKKENEAVSAEDQIKYELMLILKPDLSEDDIDKHLKEIKKLIKDSTGELYHEDLWDVRNLAFTIKKYDKGYYAIYYFTLSDTQKIATMEEELLLNNVVLRHLLVKSPKNYEIKKLSELELKEGDRRTHRVEKEETPNKKPSSKKVKKEEKPPKKEEVKKEEKASPKKEEVKKEEKASPKKEEVKKEEKKPDTEEKKKAMDISDLDSELESLLDDPDININI